MKLTVLITNILVLSLLSYFPISLNRIQYQTHIKDFAKVEKNQEIIPLSVLFQRIGVI